MAATEGKIIEEFLAFDIQVQYGSPVLDKLVEVGGRFGFSPGELCDQWVAYSTQQQDCALELEALEKWEAQLHASSRRTPSAKRSVSKTKAGPPVMYTSDNISDLFEMNDGADDALLDVYGTPQDKERLKKRTAEQTTPTTPVAKAPRHAHNGATPTTPMAYRTPSTPLQSAMDTSLVSSTPAVKYSQRQNSGNVVCTLNEGGIPTSWHGLRNKLELGYYDNELALKHPYQYMFQKVSEKAGIVLDRIEHLGRVICQHSCLPEALLLKEQALEPAVFTGMVVCDGEGRLNVRSCLLQGPASYSKYSTEEHTVKLEIPDAVTCCLFPGQVIAVEGINTSHNGGTVIPCTVYDQGVIPPLPRRDTKSVAGFTMIAAAGPFTTNDNLEMGALHDLLRIVAKEKPNVLLLMGPFVDATHPNIKECSVPGDATFEQFFHSQVLHPIYACIRNSRTKLVLVPSQKDVHHIWAVYPQPPFQTNMEPELERLKAGSMFVSDPCTLSINGLCVGMTSTDILFHLQASTLFKGPAGDRMSRVASQILRQQCYYPLLPAFRKEAPPLKADVEHQQQQQPPTESTELNLDLVHAFQEQHCLLPARPDLLLLPSDLKPFAKKIEAGCVCVNPGRLTKKSGGGTYAKILVSDQPALKQDFSNDFSVQIVCI